jgi:hypothetical protein
VRRTPPPPPPVITALEVGNKKVGRPWVIDSKPKRRNGGEDLPYETPKLQLAPQTRSGHCSPCTAAGCVGVGAPVGGAGARCGWCHQLVCVGMWGYKN